MEYIPYLNIKVLITLSDMNFMREDAVLESFPSCVPAPLYMLENVPSYLCRSLVITWCNTYFWLQLKHETPDHETPNNINNTNNA